MHPFVIHDRFGCNTLTLAVISVLPAALMMVIFIVRPMRRVAAA